MNPFFILDVKPDADDATIRRAYLDAIRIATPETDPERFDAVSTAYNLIKDQTARNRHLFFHEEMPADSPGELLVKFLRMRPPSTPLSFQSMKKHLRSCLKK